ncbi:MAG TPA: hypothetical protein VLA73_04740 [Burkholderiales bacterium]|nr:hypothetical protein [Burkholderiales bacterium]
MPTLTLRLPDELERKLANAAELANRPRSELARDAIALVGAASIREDIPLSSTCVFLGGAGLAAGRLRQSQAALAVEPIEVL